MDFIDENCLIFDGEEENRIEYSKVHERFKDMVERLLTDFLNDIGVSPTTFVDVRPFVLKNKSNCSSNGVIK